MSAVTRMDEWPSRADTVGRSTPFANRTDAWLWRSVWRLAPLGSPRRRQRRETDAEIESGFSGVPSGFANIKSRSAGSRNRTSGGILPGASDGPQGAPGQMLVIR